MNSLNVKKGDKVLVLTGKDKGKTSTVLACDPKTNRIIVKDINVQKKNVKARSAQQQGGIMDKEGAINASNVMVVCPKCDKATRVSVGADKAGKKIRVCKKCGAELKFVAESKKKAPAKKASAKKAKPAAEEVVEA